MATVPSAEAPVWVKARWARQKVVSDKSAGKGGDGCVDIAVAVIGVGVTVLRVGC